MHFFRNKNRPRSSFEIQVGNFHLLEVTVHLVTHRRNSDSRRRNNNSNSNSNSNKYDQQQQAYTLWDWYDTNREDINEEFLELLEASILSRMFGTEIEEYHRRKNPAI